jgi:4-hydroxyphenylacetate 3-monooxygenase
MLHGCTRLAVNSTSSPAYFSRRWTSRAPSFRGVQTRLGEVLAWRNMMWALTDSMAHNPDPWIGDTVLPNANAGLAYRWFMTVGYPRVKEIIEQDLGSALIYLNLHAADFKNPDIRPYLDKYVRGPNGYDAVNRVKVMKLLWDAIGSEFGAATSSTSAIIAAITRPSARRYSPHTTPRASPKPIATSRTSVSRNTTSMAGPFPTSSIPTTST